MNMSCMYTWNDSYGARSVYTSLLYISFRYSWIANFYILGSIALAIFCLMYILIEPVFLSILKQGCPTIPSPIKNYNGRTERSLSCVCQAVLLFSAGRKHDWLWLNKPRDFLFFFPSFANYRLTVSPVKDGIFTGDHVSPINGEELWNVACTRHSLENWKLHGLATGCDFENTMEIKLKPDFLSMFWTNFR